MKSPPYLLLSVCTVDKSKVEISQNFVVFPKYMNFMLLLMFVDRINI